ncbi:uncharacterized protein LOC119299420 [Triticum dicoccoides]|uniref:uncharacterized protein LOC119299420 n=1 Tax=Triticum dicoccoides TaxID=85692 RepID=UPI001890753D|nr:uncharacterized protein LOC119299420 [Triticum dicoccoides]
MSPVGARRRPPAPAPLPPPCLLGPLPTCPLALPLALSALSSLAEPRKPRLHRPIPDNHLCTSAVGHRETPALYEPGSHMQIQRGFGLGSAPPRTSSDASTLASGHNSPSFTPRSTRSHSSPSAPPQSTGVSPELELHLHVKELELHLHSKEQLVV